MSGEIGIAAHIAATRPLALPKSPEELKLKIEFEKAWNSNVRCGALQSSAWSAAIALQLLANVLPVSIGF